MLTQAKPALPATPNEEVAHTLAEKLRIGREVKQALDAIVPENRRMTDKQIAEALGCSQQYVTRIELLALYKLRLRCRELMRQERN